MTNSNRPRTIQIYKNKGLEIGTNTLPLPTNGMLVSLDIQIRAKNGTTNNDLTGTPEPTVSNAVDLIQVSSGSAIFKSYTGAMNRKIAAYRNGRLPPALLTGIVGGTWVGNDDPLLGWQTANFPVDFCTKADPYGNKTNTVMPAPLYSSLDLRIDYDPTISNTAGFVTGNTNNYVDVFATILPNPGKQALESKRILTETKKVDYTTVVTGDQSFQLTREPGNVSFLRQLFVDCYEAGIGEGEDCTYLTLQEDGNNEIAGSWGYWQHKNAVDAGLNIEKTYYASPTTTGGAHVTGFPAALIKSLTNNVSVTTPLFATYNNDTITVTCGSAEEYTMTISSPVLPAMAVMDFDVDGLMANMQPTNVNSLDLVVTNGGAGGTMQVLEQHVSKAWGYN
jgi:hypothetical protein